MSKPAGPCGKTGPGSLATLSVVALLAVSALIAASCGDTEVVTTLADEDGAVADAEAARDALEALEAEEARQAALAQAEAEEAHQTALAEALQAAEPEEAAPAEAHHAAEPEDAPPATDTNNATLETTSAQARQAEADPFAEWNGLAPQPWWRESKPYSCLQPANPASPWIESGMTDLGGSDPLSLVRYFGNGSYLRYGYMGFEGCTPVKKHPGRTHSDPPADPTYYSLGDLDIAVDIARVPPDAPGWFEDDGTRETMGMAEAVSLLNTHIAPYYEKISEGKLRMRFHAGNDFPLEGRGSPDDVRGQQLRLAGVIDCRGDAAASDPCTLGDPGGLNRLLLTDVTADGGGDAYNGSARFGLVSLREANMETLVHEIGHGWMNWPHSFAEVLWYPNGAQEGDPDLPNPYSNALDFMSGLALVPQMGWHQDMPSTLAVNRYAAGWIDPAEVALHLSDAGTYTLHPPRQRGHQFLVISSGRRYAFTTVEVLDERSSAYVDHTPQVYDPSSPGERRPFRYVGVLVSRYDQSNGTGAQARLGPALYNRNNPDFASDVGWGRDDYSVIQHGEARDIGGGIRVEVSRNEDGSYEVTVSGGPIAEFTPWCFPIWFTGEYDTGCELDAGHTP